MTIHTGAGGYDLFSETFENKVGFYRIYQPKKCLRIAKSTFKRKSLTKGRYKLLKED